MRIGSLFTGIGGLDLAAETFFDAHTVWTCDHDPAVRPASHGPTKILAARFPDAPNLGDITRTDWAGVEPVDVVTAGWPCQPFSHAGRQEGAADERALWPYVADAVRVLRPRFVFLENVAAITTVRTGPELARAVGTLAQLGYVGRWLRLRASDVGAPHRRARIFILAVSAADAEDNGHERGGEAWRRWAGPADGDPQPVGDPLLLPTPTVVDSKSGRNATAGRTPGAQYNTGWTLSDTAYANQFGRYGAAIGHWTPIVGRPAPDPTIDGRLSARFVEWMLGYPDGWVCDVPGLSRAQQLKALGNSVVPQQAFEALRRLGKDGL